MKNGDIFKWSYNEEQLKKMGLQYSAGTLYWCCSRIGVFNDGYLEDTFWNSSTDKCFSIESIKEKLTLEFIANEDDLVSANTSEKAYYLDSDCFDLNHPNSTRGNFYLRKGAKKNIAKMELILKRERNHIASSIKSQLRSISQLEDQLKNVTIESFICPTPDSVSLSDSSWEDYEAEVIVNQGDSK